MDRRQTQENPKEGAGSQPTRRVSRLAQPRKYSATPQSSNRNRSSSHENLSYQNRQIRNRSRSVNPTIRSETPIRQPIARSLSSLFTPASTGKSAASTNRATVSTIRKSVLKKTDNEQTARILGVLRIHFGPTFLPAGLQSMSAKQFVEIIGFFAQKITGGKVVIHENNVDDVKHFVDFMEYPHQMNKSWFKAPTVSIAYDRNVEFLDWLCDFVVDDDGDSVIDDLEYRNTEPDSLVDQQFVAGFVGDLKNGFAIWSDETAEFDKWKFRWIQQIIQNKTGLDDIDAAIGRIQNEYAMLQTKDVPYGNENLLQTQQKKLDDLKKEVAKLQAARHEKEVDLRESSDELKGLALANRELTNTVKQMKDTIKSQPVSADDRQKFIADLNQKRHLLDEKKVFGNSLKEIADDSQVKIARLKRQKTSKIFAINAIIQKLFQIGSKFGDLTIDQLSIKESDTKTELKAKLELFTQVKEIVNARRADIHTAVNGTQSQLTSISNELFVVETEVSTHKKNLHSLEIRLRKLADEMVETKNKSEIQQAQLQIKIDKTTEQIQQTLVKIENSEKIVESLRAENKSIYEGIQLKTDAMLQAKRERQARQEVAIAELEQLTEELKDAVRHIQ